MMLRRDAQGRTWQDCGPDCDEHKGSTEEVLVGAEPKGFVSGVLGPTSGSQDGNVRAIIAIILTVGFVAFTLLSLLLFVQDAANQALKDIVLAAAGTLGASFTGVVGMYMGTRASQTAQAPLVNLVQAQNEHIALLLRR